MKFRRYPNVEPPGIGLLRLFSLAGTEVNVIFYGICERLFQLVNGAALKSHHVGNPKDITMEDVRFGIIFKPACIFFVFQCSWFNSCVFEESSYRPQGPFVRCWFGMRPMKSCHYTVQCKTYTRASTFGKLCAAGKQKLFNVCPGDAAWRWIVENGKECFVLFAVHNGIIVLLFGTIAKGVA